MQNILAALILACGILYGLLLCREGWKRRAKPSLSLALSQAAVYFLTTMGFPDFLMNTLLLRRTGWVEDRLLPGTLVTSCIFPGALIAFVYLRGSGSLGAVTLLLCAAAIAAGSAAGARVVTSLSAGTIRRVMGWAMVGSIAALLVKMALSSGAPGSASLTFPRLCIALPVVFALGFINMFGIPMKPTATALFLLLGLDPKAVHTLVLTIGIVSPLSGGTRVLKSGEYHRETALAGTVFGGLGALAGTALTVSLPGGALNLILIVMMAAAALSMLRGK